MNKPDKYMIALIAAGIIAIGVPVTAALIQLKCQTKLYTEDWDEARQFARECEDAGGTIRMRPYWNKYEDKPYAATLICLP